MCSPNCPDDSRVTYLRLFLKADILEAGDLLDLVKTSVSSDTRLRFRVRIRIFLH